MVSVFLPFFLRSRHISSVTYNANTGTNTLSYLVNSKYNTNGYLYRLEDGSGNRLREVNSINALGMETDVLLGNGLTTTKSYTPEGLWTNVKTGSLQDMSFNFNRINGTLNSRTDNVHSLNESFTYDGLYRLKTYGSKTMDYNPNGNILDKSDVGGYTYPDTSKPYTLSTVTNATADLTGQLNINYTVMSRPVSISKPSGPSTLVLSYQYNDDYDRSIMNLSYFSTVVLSKYYFGGGKYEIDNSGSMQRLYLDGSPYTASIVLEKDGDAAPTLHYLHRDYLGSVTQISDNNGNLAAEYSYDAWGRMRDVNTWQPYAQGSQPTLMFGRGYTGHEHLNDFGLINMNARLYDPLLARFLAPDPYVGSGMTNDFNRYIYCLNNPLMYTDPSGKSLWSWLKQNVFDAFKREWNSNFGSSGGFEIGYNSMGGGFINPTYNGAAFGPSVGISNSGQITAGNSQGGLHTMSPITNKPQIDPVAMEMYQVKNEMRYEQGAEQEFDKIYKPEIVDHPNDSFSNLSAFFANRYKNPFAFISTPEGGYSISLLSKGLNIDRYTSPVNSVISSAYPANQLYNNEISRDEATYNFTTSIITTGVSYYYTPLAGFVTGTTFEVIKDGYKYLYNATEQWATPYINQFNNRIISIALPNN